MMNQNAYMELNNWGFSSTAPLRPSCPLWQQPLPLTQYTHVMVLDNDEGGKRAHVRVRVRDELEKRR